MNPLRELAATYNLMADQLDTQAKNCATGLGLAGALVELRAAECEGCIDRQIWLRGEGRLDATWSVWDGSSHYRGKTLAEAMGNWRASRAAPQNRTVEDIQAEDGPELANLAAGINF